MAFRRRRRFGRRRRFHTRRRGGYKGKFIAKSRMNRGGPRPELKYFDAWDGGNLDGTVIGWFNFASNGANFIVMNQVPEGTSANSRIGRRINMKSIEITLTFAGKQASATAVIFEFYRIMLIYDRQSNAALPAITDVIASTKSNAANLTTGMSPLNLNNRDRFLVLRDWRFNRSCASAESTSAAATIEHVENARFPRTLHWYVKLKGAETTFNSTAVVANNCNTINTGGLFLMLAGYQTDNTGTLVVSSTANYAVIATSRLRFYD